MLTKNLVLEGARLPIEDASNQFFLSFCKTVGQVIFDLCCSDVFLEQIYMLAENSAFLNLLLHNGRRFFA